MSEMGWFSHVPSQVESKLSIVIFPHPPVGLSFFKITGNRPSAESPKADCLWHTSYPFKEAVSKWYWLQQAYEDIIWPPLFNQRSRIPSSKNVVFIPSTCGPSSSLLFPAIQSHFCTLCLSQKISCLISLCGLSLPLLPTGHCHPDGNA